MDIGNVLQFAVGHHQSGRLDDAAVLYRQILENEPDHADALHLLGLVHHQKGEHDQALELVERALRSNPTAHHFHNSLGIVYGGLGRLDDAIASFRRAVELRADFAEASFNEGNALRALGRREEAESAYRKALSLQPDNADVLNNLGTLLDELDRPQDAVECLRAAKALMPADAYITVNLGVVLGKIGRLDEAKELLVGAAKSAPDMPEAHYGLGKVLSACGQSEAAEAAYRHALELDADYLDARTNLGAILVEKGQADEAVPLLRRVAETRTGDIEAHTNLIKAYLNTGRAGDAVDTYRDLAALHPENANVRAHFGTCLLLTGQLHEGFREFEWRSKSALSEGERVFGPRWDGVALDGKTILLHAEQGMGDVVQFVRYVPRVVERGGRVILECYPPLMRLLSSVEGVERVVPRDKSLPDYDRQLPLASLPLVCGTDIDTIPADVPYLTVPEDAASGWGERMEESGVLKVGLVWAGSPAHPNDPNRSCPAGLLKPLLDVSGVDFYGLQIGERAGDIATSDPGSRVRDLSPFIGDFADCAAALTRLDLLISVDTAPVHVAGALGCPVWVLLPFVPDWRWMLGRDDSPWYPTARLFRQSRMGDWPELIERVKGALEIAVRASL